MKKEMNNKGFSLVELIIVIAIMAVLVGVLAPQYLKYVNNSKVSADITNADSLATAFNVAIADGKKIATAASGDTTYTGAANTNTGLPTASNINVSVWPQTKYEAGATWTVTLNTNGVKKVTLTTTSGTYQLYPNPDDSTDGFNKLKN